MTSSATSAGSPRRPIGLLPTIVATCSALIWSRRPVRKAAGARALTRMTVPVPLQGGNERAADEEWPGEVDGENALPIGGIVIFDRQGRPGEPRIVDQDVDIAAPLQREVSRGIDALRVRHIDRNGIADGFGVSICGFVAGNHHQLALSWTHVIVA